MPGKLKNSPNCTRYSQTVTYCNIANCAQERDLEVTAGSPAKVSTPQSQAQR